MTKESQLQADEKKIRNTKTKKGQGVEKRNWRSEKK